MRSARFLLPRRPGNDQGRAAAIVAALALAGCSVQGSAPPVDRLSGLYSDVRLSHRTGDVGGIEIEVHANAPAPYAEFVWCEGWCNQSYRIPIEVSGDSFSFVHSEDYFEANGEYAGTHSSRMQATLTNKGLLLRGQGDVNLDARLLARSEHRFGLDVAEESMRRAALKDVP